jgi:small subunit ribosomal protein S4
LVTNISLVDGEVVNIPSYSVKPGQIVGVREKAKSLEVIEAALLVSITASILGWNGMRNKSGKFCTSQSVPTSLRI